MIGRRFVVEQVLAAGRTAPGTTEYREYPMPDVPADGALLKVEVAGVCATDVKVYAKPAIPGPVIMGHENVHWGRYRGLANRIGRPPLAEHVMRNVFFDTCVYHQAGIDLLFRVIGVDNILFASELHGAVRGVDPQTGHHWDDTKRYIDSLGLSPTDLAKIMERNARRVYPRLAALG